jgi:hypothetical protein
VAVDVGSVGPPSKFAWAGFDAPGREVVASGSIRGPRRLRCYLAWRTADGRCCSWSRLCRCPSPQGAADSWRELGRARDSEGNRPWSAGAGAAVLATGLAQGAWMLGSLAAVAHG